MLDVERVVAEFLLEKTDIPVYLEVPKDRPSEFITVEQTSTGGTRFAKIVYLAVQSWAETRKLAEEISEMVEEAVFELDEIPNFFNPNATQTYRFPDPASKQQRYQTTVELMVCE